MRSEKGYTLAGALIIIAALSIFCTAILATLTDFSVIFLQNKLRGTVYDLAQNQMKYIQNQPYAPLADNVVYLVGATLTDAAPHGSTLLYVSSTANLPVSGTINIGSIESPLKETRVYTVASSTIISVAATSNDHKLGEPVYLQYSPAHITSEQSKYAVTIAAQSLKADKVQEIFVTVYERGISKVSLTDKKIKP